MRGFAIYHETEVILRNCFGEPSDFTGYNALMKTGSVFLQAAMMMALAIPVSLAQTAPPARRTGYLSAEQAPDVTKIVPSAPTSGDARDTLDLSVFRATRALEGTPRWELARSDNEVSVAAMMRAFSCAAGITLDAEKTPKLNALLGRALVDATSSFNRLKNFYPDRKRPYLVAQGPICLATTTPGLTGPDYPSGHTTFGWSVGLILADLIPGRSTDLLVRARAFGESRVICGVHNSSAIEAGRIVADSTISALRGNVDFRKDLEAARDELAALSASVVPSGKACTTEAELVSQRFY
jgi:acid phosphatase (class A)